MKSWSGSSSLPEPLRIFFAGAKEEILANLANFAYDPINYDHFRKLNVVDLFMGELQICIQWLWFGILIS